MSKNNLVSLSYNVYDMKSNNKGFTLIELLVVLTVVGLMSSLLLVYVKSVKNQAIDNSIKSNLLTIRSQSAIYYSDVGNYNYFISEADNPGTIQLQAYNMACYASGVACISASDPRGWYVKVSLKSKPGFSWCVDYLGNSKEIITGAANIDDEFACP